VSAILLSVLTPTLSSRQAKFLRLMSVLLPQAEADGRVEVVALQNDGERTIAEYRQALLEDARGRWVAFVDDDDMVEPDYVALITEALREDPDYVAFRHAYYEDGVRHPLPVVTGIKHRGWFNTSEALVRDITHVNPMRASIARRADFRIRVGDALEDASFDAQVRSLLKTQVVIDGTLYHYHHSRSDSVQHRLAPHAFAPRPVIESPAFRWHPWSTG